MLNYLVPSIIHIYSRIWYRTTEFYVPFIIVFQDYITTINVTFTFPLQLTVLCAKEPRTTVAIVNWKGYVVKHNYVN